MQSFSSPLYYDLLSQYVSFTGDYSAALFYQQLADTTRLTDVDNRQIAKSMGRRGSMLCANFLHGWTSEDRWKGIFLFQAQRLLSEWERIQGAGYLWNVDLYGQKQKYLGPVHGFAGNLIPLIKGGSFCPKASTRNLLEGGRNSVEHRDGY